MKEMQAMNSNGSLNVMQSKEIQRASKSLVIMKVKKKGARNRDMIGYDWICLMKLYNSNL